MSRASLATRLLVALVAAGPGLSSACGPGWWLPLFEEREQALLAAPEGMFDFEFERQRRPPADAFEVNEAVDTSRPWQGRRLPSSSASGSRGDFEAREASGAFAARIAAMRRQRDDDSAYAAGTGLPEAVREYTAGAVAFLRAAPTRRFFGSAKSEVVPVAQEHLERAFARFQAVLDLPAADGRPRAVWAAYMQGRVRQEQGRHAEAGEPFRRVRSLVRDGWPDPLGLAVASLGEEALSALAAGDLPLAASLYLEQAEHGSQIGYDSLRELLWRIAADPAQQRNVLEQPRVARLLVAFGFSQPRVAPDLGPLLDAFEQAGLHGIAGLDRLAALAYAQGDFARAQRIVDLDDTGLATWIAAKLALRRGDREWARAALARGRMTLGGDESWSMNIDSVFARGAPVACRVDAERGVLALAQGDYVAALEHLLAARVYQVDLAYVAERLVDTDDLRRFVDARSAARGDAGTPAMGVPWVQRDPLTMLRGVLARRLLREGRAQDAAPYFDAVDEQHSALALADAVRRARNLANDPIERARGWFEAARMLARDGMEIIGYELAPDFHIVSGDYETRPRPAPAEWMAADEDRRLLATRAEIDQRFHYRFVGARYLDNAADLLPPRSQAFAAVLCHGAGWYNAREPELARRWYARYVDEGALVPWAGNFGRQCQEPDFARADAQHRLARQQRWSQVAGWAMNVAFTCAVLAAMMRFAARQRAGRRAATGHRDGGVGT
ncbi:MAG: hypothetical protein AB7Q81_18750 [Gammaproteobacteria bacterium]